MFCPFCRTQDTQVVDSRVSPEGNTVRRRRGCTQCGRRFTTFEKADLQLPFIVKRNGQRADYDRQKLRRSFLTALRKRPVSSEAVENALDRIEGQLVGRDEREIGSLQLGEMVLTELSQLDTVAFIRFASVYRDFAKPDEFAEIIRSIANEHVK